MLLVCFRPVEVLPKSNNIMSAWGEAAWTQRWISSSDFSDAAPPALVFLSSLWEGLDNTLSPEVKWPLGKKQKGFHCSAVGGDVYELCFFVIYDRLRVDLPFIQMLTCFVWYSQWNTRRDFLMIYVCQRSRNSPVMTLVVAGVCITKYFCEIQKGKPIRWMKIGLMCLQKSVNNINFLWMNMKVGSGNSHMGIFKLKL